MEKCREMLSLVYRLKGFFAAAPTLSTVITAKRYVTLRYICLSLGFNPLSSLHVPSHLIIPRGTRSIYFSKCQKLIHHLFTIFIHQIFHSNRIFISHQIYYQLIALINNLKILDIFSASCNQK